MIDFAIVTGASQNHFKSLKQFINSIDFTNVRCYVYDLGLNNESYIELRNIPGINLRTFDYSKYPSYFNININAGEYAWKPAIINEVATDLVSEGNIKYLLWCDSGNKLIDPSLISIRNFINENKIYSPSSEGNITRWTYPLTIKWFSIPDNSPFLNYQNRNGAILAFKIDEPDVFEFINEFASCAAIKDCIAPEGSSRMNHRQDQAVFTILYFKFLEKNPNLKMENAYLHISIHNDCD
jgi:hypothetical protein